MSGFLLASTGSPRSSNSLFLFVCVVPSSEKKSVFGACIQSSRLRAGPAEDVMFKLSAVGILVANTYSGHYYLV